MKYLFTLMLVISFLTGCSQISENKLTVIDGIILGKPSVIFYKNLDDLGLKKTPFYTKQLFSDIDEIESSMLNGYKTEIVNLEKYKSSVSQHWGLIYPNHYEGTDNIIGVIIILCNVGKTNAFLQSSFVDITEETGMLGIDQAVSTLYVDDIKKMLISRYGQPKSTFTSEYNDFFVIEGHEVTNYNGSENIKGALYTWETDYYDVELFEGIPNYGTSYLLKDKTYLRPFGSVDLSIQEPNQKPSQGESFCYSFPYIRYILNDKTINMLKLNIPKF